MTSEIRRIAGQLIESERQYASQLDILLQSFWIPLVTDGIVDGNSMPEIFGNIEVIATAHVPILDSIDRALQEQETTTDDDALMEQALAAARCVVNELLNTQAGDEAMLPLYKAYGIGVLARVAQYDEHMAKNAKMKEFVDRSNAALEEVSFLVLSFVLGVRFDSIGNSSTAQEMHLRKLLLKPRRRLFEYYTILRELRRFGVFDFCLGRPPTTARGDASVRR